MRENDIRVKGEREQERGERERGRGSKREARGRGGGMRGRSSSHNNNIEGEMRYKMRKAIKRRLAISSPIYWPGACVCSVGVWRLCRGALLNRGIKALMVEC